MKFSLLIISLLSSLLSFGQSIPTDSETGRFKYEKVIQAEGLSQSEIYDLAKNWVVRTLKSSDNVIDLDNENKSAIVATGNILLSNQKNKILKYTDIVVNFKFSVYLKDNRFKVIVDNFFLSYYVIVSLEGIKHSRNGSLEEGIKKEGLYKGDKSTAKMYEEFDAIINQMLTDIEKSVNSKNIAGDDDDW